MFNMEDNHLIPKPRHALENYQRDKHYILLDNASTEPKQRPMEDDQPKDPKHVARKVNEPAYIKFRPIDEDPKLETKITELQKLINGLSRDKLQVTKLLQEKSFDWRDIVFALEELNSHERRLRDMAGQIWKEEDIFVLFLDKIQFAENSRHKKKPAKSSLSREELVQHKLQFRVLHGTTSLAEEKQLFREIKASGAIHEDVVNSFLSLEEPDDLYYSKLRCKKTHRNEAKDRLGEIITWPRKENVAEAIVLGKMCNSLSSTRKSVREHVKVLRNEIDEVRKKKLRKGPKVGHLNGELKMVEKEIKSLKKQLADIIERKKEAYQCFLQLMKEKPSNIR